MRTIGQEPEEPFQYKRINLDYNYVLNKLYTDEDNEKAKQSPSLETEYNLKYFCKIGNVFSLTDIDKAIELGTRYKDLLINPFALNLLGIDFGFDSNVTDLYITELDPQLQIVRIIVGYKYDKKTPSVTADRMFQLHSQISNISWFVD